MNESQCTEVEFHIRNIKIKAIRKKGSQYYYGCEYLSEHDLDINLSEILSITPDEFPENLYISTPTYTKEFDLINHIEAAKKDGVFHLRLRSMFNTEKWDIDIAPLRYINALANEVEKSLKLEDKTDELIDGYLDVEVSSTPIGTETIRKEIVRISEIFNRAHDYVLRSKAIEGISTQFNFPEESRHIYSQYLMYFGQFLEDLGIKAKISLSNEKESTILNIEPIHKDQALQDIRTALSAYLCLTLDEENSLVRASGTQNSEAKTLQLNATINHLKSQLQLQQAISSTQATNIKLLQQYITHSETIKTTESQSKLEPFDGLKITRYRGSFFEIDIPKLASKLKNIFPRK